MRDCMRPSIPEHFQNSPQNDINEHFPFEVDQSDYPFVLMSLSDQWLPVFKTNVPLNCFH